jgi:hypothetical protein
MNSRSGRKAADFFALRVIQDGRIALVISPDIFTKTTVKTGIPLVRPNP